MVSDSAPFAEPVQRFGGATLLSATRWIEARRESFSGRLAPVDPTGWLRSWLVGESSSSFSRPSEQGVPPSLFFMLGYVHLLTSAGVHLLLLGTVTELIVTGLCSRAPAAWVRPLRAFLVSLQWSLFAWVWALSGWRWGLLRPLTLMALQQVSRARGWKWQRGVPLVASVSLEAVLAGVFRVDAAWGRWHYFLAVWGGAWGVAGKTGWRAHFGMAFGSWIAVVPLQLAHEGWVALSTPVLSLITIPVAGYVLMPLALAMEALPNWPVLDSALGVISNALWQFTLPVARLPGALWSASASVFAAAVIVVLGVRALAPAHLRSRVLAVIVVAALAYRWVPSGGKPGSAETRAEEVVQLDVGQGDAALVSWKDGSTPKMAAVDVGSSRASDPARWIRALARRGVVELDAVVLTHEDEDHAGALEQILPWIRIRCVLLPPTVRSEPESRLRRLLQERGIPVRDHSSSCFPFPWLVAVRDSRANGVMGGVLIPLRSGGAYLNLGDAGWRKGASEQALAEAFERHWPALWNEARSSRRSVLKLGHHGSRFSSSQELLDAFEPATVVVSSGPGNRHGHPHAETLERARGTGARVLRTDRHGAVILH